MVVSMYSVDSMINAYNKQQRVKARHVALDDWGGAGKGKTNDEVTLSKQGVEAAEIYNKLTNKLIDNMLKEEKK